MGNQNHNQTFFDFMQNKKKSLLLQSSVDRYMIEVINIYLAQACD